VVRDPTQAKKASHLRKLKANIIKLNSIKQSGILLDTDDRDRITGEDPSLHQYLKSRKRRVMRTITQALDKNGHLKTDQKSLIFAQTT
jgi:hypothetical protein